VASTVLISFAKPSPINLGQTSGRLLGS
jgi:hypothetical protein